MKTIKPSAWIKIFITVLCIVLAACMGTVALLDPFFHYHRPLGGFFYVLDNERSQNDGIIRHFDYDALITGTSLTQNFRPSEADELFGVHSVKVCFAGATFAEIEANIEKALDTRDVRMVIRCLDDNYLVREADERREDMGDYPDWLYNDNPLDDVKYLLSGDVLARYCGPMLIGKLSGRPGGITSFDEYSNWMEGAVFGHDPVMWNVLSAETQEHLDAGLADMDGYHFTGPVPQRKLTAEELETERVNIEKNVLAAAKLHPETTFYYYFPPLSGIGWQALYAAGEAEARIEAQRAAAELILAQDNIKLYSFASDTYTTDDPDNYKDTGHYGEWVNTYILECMASDPEKGPGTHRLTAGNAGEYFAELEELYLTVK